MSERKLVVGCGYLGLRVAQLWLAAGDQVFAVTRSPSKAERLASLGIEPIVGDVVAGPLELPVVDTVLFAIGYERASKQPIQQVYAGGLSHVLSSKQLATAKFIYISSTGVYAQNDGGWVNEQSPCRPVRAGAVASLAAEELLRSSSRRGMILRMAGLYGPGRIPRSAELLAGKPIDAPAHGWLNLIHVDDAAAIVLAAERKGTPGAVYVIADGAPPTRRQYYEELARLLGAPPPVFAPPPADSPAAERAAADKRVDSSRSLHELGVQLCYPTFRHGLAAIVASASATPSG